MSNPDPYADAPWIKDQHNADARSERIRVAAVAYAQTLDELHADWSEDFSQWCVERYADRDGTTQLPSFKRAWPVYWGEPVAALVEELDDDELPA